MGMRGTGYRQPTEVREAQHELLEQLLAEDPDLVREAMRILGDPRVRITPGQLEWLELAGEGMTERTRLVRALLRRLQDCEELEPA